MMQILRNMLSMLLMLLGGFLFFFFLLPQVFGILPKVVLSGSMEPEIPVGSIVYIEQKTKPEQLAEGDVIAYQMGDATEVLHRIIAIRKEENSFVTKGDANPSPDPGEIAYTQYCGRELLMIPWLGYGVAWLKSGVGKTVTGSLVILFFFTEGILQRKEKKT